MESEKKAADLVKAHKKSSCSTTFSGGTQMTLEMAGGRKYSYGSEKYQCITKKLANLIGSTNTPFPYWRMTPLSRLLYHFIAVMMCLVEAKLPKKFQLFTVN